MDKASEEKSDSFRIRVSIKNKILFSVVLVVTLSMMATTYVSVLIESKAFHKNLILKGQNITDNIASSTRSAFWSLNWIFVEKLLQDSTASYSEGIIYTKIVKPGGEVYLANDRKYYGTMVDPSLLSETERVIEKYDFQGQKGILLTRPVLIGKDHWHILLGLSTDPIRMAMKDLIINNIIWGCIFLVLAIIVSLFLSHSISSPIVELAKTVKMISDGDRDRFIDVRSNDETGLLGHSFNKMIENIRAAEKALILSNERFVTVLDSVDATIYVADIDTYEILFMNRAMKKVFGADHVGKKCYKVFRGEEKPCSICQNDRLLDEFGSPTGGVNWEERNPITNRWYMNYDRAIKWTDDRMVHLQIAFDTTDTRELVKKREETEAKLRQSQKMEAIGKLAGGVAHDLNNILSGIINYPEIMLLDLPEDHEMRELILEIKSSGEKAATIVDDLLTLARRGVSVNEAIDLNVVIAQYLTSPEYEKLSSFHPNVLSRLSLAEDLKPIKGSPVHLSKMIMNLISNAAEAMPDGGNIYISTQNRDGEDPKYGVSRKTPHGYIRLTVEDEGTGIKKEEQEKIFEPFYTKKVMGRSGTGLGMAVVWGTVEDHDGTIELSSTMDKGTRFDLYFPVTAREIKVRIDHENNLSELRGNGETILVVDDVKEQREIAVKLLNWLGYTVHSVDSGEAAVEFVKSQSVDLMILDMIMDPGINGLQTFKRVLEINPDQKTIISSGYSESDEVKQALRLGACRYIHKPYTIETFAKAVNCEINPIPQSPLRSIIG